MAKRIKRLEKGIESLKEEIENHFIKLECDIKINNFDLGRYHSTELEKSLIKSLEIKLDILNIKDHSLHRYKDRLDKLKKKLDENNS